MTNIPKTTMSTHEGHLMQGCRQEGVGSGAKAPPPIFKVMLLCVQAVTAKGHPKFI